METLKIFFIIFILFSEISFSEIYEDSLNRKVDIKQIPQRIIALGPGALRMISYLKAVDKLVATENIEIKYPVGRPYSIAYREELKKLPVVSEGGPDKTPDYEKIIYLRPDLIIVCSIDNAIIENIQSKTRIPVFSTDYGNLGTFDSEKFKNAILKLGKILGVEKRALKITEKVDFYSRDLKKRTKAKVNKSIYVGGLGFKGSHGILSTQYSYEPFKLIGLNSVVDDGKSHAHIFIDREKLLSYNPEYIFIDDGGLNIIIDDMNKNMDFYSMLKAFKNKNVYTTLPYNYYTTNVEIVFTNAYFIGKILFPSSFMDIDIDKISSDIIKDFIGRDVYREFVKGRMYYKRIKDGNKFD